MHTGDAPEAVEMRYEDENIWLTQKIMATLYGVTVPAINQHLKRIFDDSELTEAAVIKQYLISRKIPMTMQDWEERLNRFLAATDREILQNAGKVTAEIAHAHAESEFEKYRVIQDQIYVSDFDRFTELPPNSKNSKT